MKPILSAITILALGMILVAEVGAGPRRVIVAPRARSGAKFFSGSVPNRMGVHANFMVFTPIIINPIIHR